MKSNAYHGDTEHFYSHFYEDVICQKGFGAKAVHKTHRKMEEGLRHRRFENCLELGGGRGEHLDFVLHEFTNYTVLDLRKDSLKSPWDSDSRVTRVEGDASKVPFRDEHFDRVIVTCLLHHVNEPELVLSEIRRVLKVGGIATIFLPCDPGLVVRTARYLTTQRKAGKAGFSGYDLMISREHRNHVGGLIKMIEHHFKVTERTLKWYPFRVRSWNLNAYLIVSVQIE